MVLGGRGPLLSRRVRNTPDKNRRGRGGGEEVTSGSDRSG